MKEVTRVYNVHSLHLDFGFGKKGSRLKIDENGDIRKQCKTKPEIDENAGISK